MRRILTFVALALVAAALWAVTARLSGPHVGPLHSERPYVVRDPPSNSASFPQPTTGLGPGDEVSRLHARGITGLHVGIAIIDRPLLTRHQEFAARLRWYDEIDTEPDEPAGLATPRRLRRSRSVVAWGRRRWRTSTSSEWA